MPVFTYRAKRGPGDVKEGTILADSVDAAVEKLNLEGYIPSVITEGDLNPVGKDFSLFSKRVKSKDINIFTGQLANLLKSKVTLPAALDIIHKQTENFTLRNLIGDMVETVNGGGNLSDVLAKNPACFSPIYLNNVRSGEIGCVLEESLARLAKYSEKEEEFKMKVRIAIAYPIFMLSTGILTVFVLLAFVMPKLTVMFEDMGQSLPLPTQIVIGISNGIRNYWYLLLIGIIVLGLNLKRKKFSDRERHVIDSIKLNLPVLGKFIKEAEILRFARMVSLLLDNGLALYRAIEVAIPTLSNIIIKDDLKKVSERVVDGISFSKSLQNSKLFPPFVISMLTVGEEGGNLSDSLNEVADYYEREGDQAMKIMSSLLEPTMILFMGIVIGFIVISMLLPIFELNVLTGG